MQANQRVSPPRRSQLTGSIVCYARDARFIVSQAARRGDCGLTTAGNPGNVGLSFSLGGMDVMPKKARTARSAVIAAVVGGCLIWSDALRTTTIDFNGLLGNDGSPFTSYTEFGFTVGPLSGRWLVGQRYGHPPPYIFFKNPSPTADSTASVEITNAGAPFRFRSIELYSSVTTIPYTFRGLTNGMTVFSTAGTVPNTFGNFARVLNPHGTDVIDKLQVMLSNPATPLCPTCLGNPVGLDNIVVDPVLGAAGGATRGAGPGLAALGERNQPGLDSAAQ
jgi:hypothetical protein